MGFFLLAMTLGYHKTEAKAMTAVNIVQALFLDDEGHVLPITDWFDEDGDDCASDEAVVCIAGTEGRWFAIDLREYEGGAVQ